MTPDIKPLVAGNWKMNGQRDQLDQLALIARGTDGQLAEKVDVLVCPPATLLYVATTLSEDTPLLVGAQDCHANASGAHTGDISAENDALKAEISPAERPSPCHPKPKRDAPCTMTVHHFTYSRTCRAPATILLKPKRILAHRRMP